MIRLAFSYILTFSVLVFANPSDRLSSIPNWQISYQLPDGWQVSQTVGRAQILMKGQDNTALVFVGAAKYNTLNDVTNELSTFFNSLGLRGYPTQNPTETTFNGKRAISAAFAGTNQQGQPLKARFLTVFTDHQSNFNIMVLGTENHFPQLGNLVEKIGASMKSKAPQINRGLMGQLRGTWVYYSSNSSRSIASSGGYSSSYEEFLTLDGQGHYRWNSNGQVSASSAVRSYGATSASDISQNADAGRYEIIGNTILIYSQRGGVLLYDFTMKGGAIVTGGRTYIRQ